MVHKEKQGIITQPRDFLNTLCLILHVEVSKFSPKHFYREGTKKLNKRMKKHLLMFVSVATSSTMMISSAKLFIG